MPTEQQLRKAYLYWFGEHTHAITFVLNRNHVTLNEGGARLREFHRQIDQGRLGGRYYNYPEESRLRFRVVTENCDTNLHFHGIIRLPVEQLEALGFSELVKLYKETWRKVAPDGSLDIQPLWNDEGWMKYCSKEHKLTDNLYALDTLIEGPKTTWTFQAMR